MTLKTALKYLVISFCAATTFQVVVVSLTELIFGLGYMPSWDLYIFPLVGLLCALPIFVLVRRESAPRWEWAIRRAVHFLLTGGLVFGTLAWYGWVTPENMWWPFGIFLFLYIAMYIFEAAKAKKLADQINAKIASHDSENVTH